MNESVGFISQGRKIYKTYNGGNSFQIKFESNRNITDIKEYNGKLIFTSSSANSKVSLFEEDDGESYIGIIRNTTIVKSDDLGEDSFDIYDFYESNNANCNGGSNICDSHGHFHCFKRQYTLLGYGW